MAIMAIDPGSEESGYVIYEGDFKKVTKFGKVDNKELKKIMGDLHRQHVEVVYCEFPVPRGQLASKDLFETCRWVGMLQEYTWRENLPSDIHFELIDRTDVIAHYQVHRRTIKEKKAGIKVPNADSQIRNSIINRFGGSKSKAIGTKKKRGPLYGITNDVWQALAIAIMVSEQDEQLY